MLSHGANLLIFKIVGFAEQIVQYYKLEDFKAHVWIAHQRYPTKGRVWHPGGAHPFIGLNEALVHNGDFANYHSVSRVPRASATSCRSSSPTPRSRCCCSICGTGSTSTRWSTSSRRWRRPPSSTSTAARRRSRRSTGRSRRPTSTPRPTARGSSSSPATTSPNDAVPAAGHHRHRHAAAAGVRPCRTARSRSA